MKRLNSSLSMNILWNAVGNLIYLGVQWLITVFVTKEMGFEQAGVFSLAMSVSAVFQAFALFGTRNFQVSDLNGEFPAQCYMEARLLTCTAAFLFSAVFCAVNRYSASIIAAICGMMCFRVAESFSDVLHGMLQNSERLNLVGISFTIRSVLIFVGFLAGYLLSGTINAVVWGMALASLLVTLGFDLNTAVYTAVLHVPKSLSYRVMMLLRKTFPLCLYQLLSAVLISLPKYMLERMLDETALGIYSAVFTPVMLIQAVSGYLFLPLAGKFTKAWEIGDRSTFLQTACRITLIIVAFSGIVLTGSYLGKDLLILVFGDEIAAHTGLLLPAVLCSLLVSLYSLLGMLEIILRDRMGLLTASVLGMLVSVILLPIMIRLYGINGANIGQIAGLASALTYMLSCLFKNMRKCESL